MVLHDHIPTARHEAIKVRLDTATPEPAERTDLGLLRWELTLAKSACLETAPAEISRQD